VSLPVIPFEESSVQNVPSAIRDESVSLILFGSPQKPRR